MEEILKFIQSVPGATIVGALLALFFGLVFRKPLGRLIDRTRRAEVSRGSVRIEADGQQSTDQQAESKGLEGDYRAVDFGKDNKFGGTWSNVAVGGDVTSAPPPPNSTEEQRRKK